MSVMNWLNDTFDFEEVGLDTMTRYGLVIMNFVMIIAIIVARRVKQKHDKDISPVSKNVLFAIAHPDDESMFFLPTISNLLEEGYKLHMLCYSNGGFDGLGKIREKELEKCCKLLGFDRCTVLNDPDILDGKDNIWPIEKMSTILSAYAENHSIEGIFTFDENGISSHPNHIDVHRAVKLFRQKADEKQKKIKIFTLDSVNFFRKYIGVLDILFSTMAQHTFLNYNPAKAWNAMKQHQSQFVYYRKLFVIFSRYAYINTLTQMK